MDHHLTRKACLRGGSGSPTASAGGRKKATATKRASTRKPRKSKRDAEAEATAAAEAKQALDSQEASAGDISEAESVDFGSGTACQLFL